MKSFDYINYINMKNLSSISMTVTQTNTEYLVEKKSKCFGFKMFNTFLYLCINVFASK